MQRSPALRFNLPAEGKHGAEDARPERGSRNAVREPILIGGGPRATSILHEFWSYSQDVYEEQLHHLVEHERLTHWISGKPLYHVPVLRQGLVAQDGTVLQTNLLPLDDEEQRLLRARK
eukprot:4042954-Pyramimonas_sp.AAC.1